MLKGREPGRRRRTRKGRAENLAAEDDRDGSDRRRTA